MSGNSFLFDILKCIESSTKRTRFSFIVRVVYKGGFCSFAHLRDSLKRCGFSWTVPRLFVILNFHIPGYLWRLLHYIRHSIITKLGLKALFIKLRFVFASELFLTGELVSLMSEFYIISITGQPGSLIGLEPIREVIWWDCVLMWCVSLCWI